MWHIDYIRSDLETVKQAFQFHCNDDLAESICNQGKEERRESITLLKASWGREIALGGSIQDDREVA